MFKWLKELFASTPGQGMVPIEAPPKKEYTYMGDGMMEEVIVTPEAQQRIEQVNKRLAQSRLDEQRSRSNLDASTIVTTAVVASSWTGDSSYSDSGSCDSSSSSCD
ncbi:hypothetical protein [Phage NC-G]|nr:hypothetical protein [Phage NC-G]